MRVKYDIVFIAAVGTYLLGGMMLIVFRLALTLIRREISFLSPVQLFVEGGFFSLGAGPCAKVLTY